MYQDKTLVTILCMHRSGSSLTANVLHRLGMSLGPFELLGPHESNKYGHFEPYPFIELTRQLQKQLLGFANEIPQSPEVLQGFCDREGRWESGESVPEAAIQRGRELLEELVESGAISGFKDPRTVLLWPYWKQVFSFFPGLRIVPLLVVRSPHEIAMSVFTRNCHAYQDTLDVSAVHFKRMSSILEGWDGDHAIVRFDVETLGEDLRQAARTCGLKWRDKAFAEAFDARSKHHQPGLVTHPAQKLFERVGRLTANRHSKANLALVEQDAARREAMLRDHIREAAQSTESFRKEVESLRQKGEEARQERERFGREREQARLEREQARREREQARREREQACRERAQFLEELDQSCQQRNQAVEERERFLQQCDHARQQSQKARQEYQQARQQAEKARQECQQTRQQAERFRQECERVRQECEKSRLQHNEARQECQKARLEGEQWRQQHSQACQEREQTRQERNRACQEREQARQERNRAYQEREQARQESSRFCQERDQARQECKQHLLQIERARQECEQFRRQIKQARQEITQARQEYQQARQQCERSRQQHEQARREIEGLAESEQRLQAELTQLKRCRLLKLRDGVLEMLRRIPLVRSRPFVATRNSVSLP